MGGNLPEHNQGRNPAPGAACECCSYPDLCAAHAELGTAPVLHLQPSQQLCMQLLHPHV